MRKGILSLSPLGRRNSPAKAKPGNMELAEKAAVKKTAEAPEQKTAPDEKMYVQTVMVPKQRKAGDLKPQPKAKQSRKPHRKMQ